MREALFPGDTAMLRVGSAALAQECPDRPPATVAPGRRYELGRVLGEGGMGIVFEARDLVLRRRVALKRVRNGEAKGPSAERFLREARVAASLSHPSIVSVFDVGRIDGAPCYTMELIEGPTLASRTGRDPREAARLVAQVARALDYAHRRGVVHRDVKPSNVLLRPDGTAAIADFGLAREVSVESSITGDAQAIGTPQYMSPEQVLGRTHEIDARSDVYSLGATLYHLATGEAPFAGGSVGEVFAKVLSGPLRSAHATRPDVPRPLARIIGRAMQRERRKRYSSAAALADDIEAFLAGKSTPAPRAAHRRAWMAAVVVASVAAVAACLRGNAASPVEASPPFDVVRSIFRASLTRWCFRGLGEQDGEASPIVRWAERVASSGASEGTKAQSAFLRDLVVHRFDASVAGLHVPDGELCAEASAGAAIRAEWLYDVAAAERLYRRSVELDPLCAEAWALLAGVLVRRGKCREALDATDACASAGNAEAAVALERVRAEAWIGLGDRTQALAHLAGGDRTRLGSDGLLDLAALDLATGDPGAAMEACDQALQENELPQSDVVLARYLRACAGATRAGRRSDPIVREEATGQALQDLCCSLTLARGIGLLRVASPDAEGDHRRPERRCYGSFSALLTTGAVESDPMLEQLRGDPRYGREILPLLAAR